MIPSGFEPETYCLEGSCSIQLSYGTEKKCVNLRLFKVENQGNVIFKFSNLQTNTFKSRGGRIRTYDLLVPNQARYRATLHPENIPLLKINTSKRRVRDSNPRYPCEVRQFSKRLLSASQATLLNTFCIACDTVVVFR